VWKIKQVPPSEKKSQRQEEATEGIGRESNIIQVGFRIYSRGFWFSLNLWLLVLADNTKGASE
jgi:hypothetical protein